MKTEKLYDRDSYIYEFKATVLSCEPDGDEFITVLDKTAFFPEGGGQKPDTGFIAGVRVVDVQTDNGVIFHRTLSPVEAGTKVDCSIDADERFRRMQSHSGEHIFSGIAHTLYGCENIGFHLTDEATIDFDRELDETQIRKIERLSNEAIYKNLKITAEYPDSETLKALEYRSKLELTEDVRIVTVEGVDVCACCAPHVSRTGEIGIIKVLGFMRHRGGVRITIKCGAFAFEHFCTDHSNIESISARLCAVQSEAAEAVNRLYDENGRLRQTAAQLKKELAEQKSKCVERTDGNLVLFDDGADMMTLRKFVLESADKAGRLCAGFSGNDNDGYIYVITSRSIPLRSMSKDINTALNGKGGGSDELLQGSIKAVRKEIEKYFSEV